MLNLKTGTAIGGVLWAQRGTLLVIRSAKLYRDSNVIDLDGDVLVEVSEVDFAQRLAPVTG